MLSIRAVILELLQSGDCRKFNIPLRSHSTLEELFFCNLADSSVCKGTGDAKRSGVSAAKKTSPHGEDFYGVTPCNYKLHFSA